MGWTWALTLKFSPATTKTRTSRAGSGSACPFTIESQMIPASPAAAARAAGLAPLPGARLRLAALRGVALVSCLAACAGAQAQWLQPGQWQFWRTGAERLAAGAAPTLEFCVSAAAAQDGVVLTGEPAGDSTCRASAVRRLSPTALTLELTCPDGTRVRGSVTQPDAQQFTTRLDQTPGRSPQPGVAYVHGRRTGECLP